MEKLKLIKNKIGMTSAEVDDFRIDVKILWRETKTVDKMRRNVHSIKSRIILHNKTQSR